MGSIFPLGHQLQQLQWLGYAFPRSQQDVVSSFPWGHTYPLKDSGSEHLILTWHRNNGFEDLDEEDIATDVRFGREFPRKAINEEIYLCPGDNV